MNRRRAKSRDGLPPPTKSEAEFERLLESLRPGGTSSAPASGAPAANAPPASEAGAASEDEAFVERLFSQKAVFLAHDRFRTIGEAASFYTKVVGVSFEGRQDIVAGLSEGAPLTLKRQPENPHDANAIAVHFGNLQLGFLKKDIARHLAPNFDSGTSYEATVGGVTGGARNAAGEAKNYGVNIFVRRKPAPTALMVPSTGAPADADAILKALIGEQPLRDAQRAVLSRVEDGRNTLAVLGTGRGKSLCFQYPAARRALESSQKTLVVYPLRALANDQYEALLRRFEGFGLRIHRANGSISADERHELVEALGSGAWDMVLATPEFLQYHRELFGGRSAPDFIVIDEAHHVHESRHRSAYAQLGAVVKSFPEAQVLALTATAGDDAFDQVVRELGIDAWVIDPTVRENLRVVDARGTRDKAAYLADLFSSGGKGIVYCNSRSGAVKVAEGLRSTLQNAVAYYHAGLGTPERLEVERLFRAGSLRVVVATSAFGEGIDLPDVRDVVLYHLNFDFTEFNQQAGRAGRDGAPAQIHLLFGEGDRRINDFIIEREAPTLETLRRIYAAMKRMTPDRALHMTYADVASTLDISRVEGPTISVAVRIFEDAELVETGEDDDGRYVRFLPVRGKVDLTATERYVEGEAEREAFARFCDVALTASPDVLEALIDRPIYPSNVPLLR